MSEESKTPNNPYAFPLEFDNSDYDKDLNSGMTLRDYFAAKALQGHLGSGKTIIFTEPSVNELAKLSYKLADAMLREREK